jgi:photolyase PhrII
MNLGELFQQLPEHLQERTRLNGEPAAATGSNEHFVLYWMRTAVRGHENPALDVAKFWAAALDLPLLIYHGLDERYEYASDRHHRFILEGARDVQQELAEQNLTYVFHLARPSDRRPHLINFARAAAVVITEEMPVDPPRKFLKQLSGQISNPIACVDTACVVPMLLTPREYTRAFEFRSATSKLRRVRLARPWPELQLSVKSLAPEILRRQFELESIDLRSADLAELIADCEIDHLVAPVWDTVGGSKAGYDRWEAFKARGLRAYDRKRNDALIDGVSRMSAYLHYGMVSPLRIAREADEQRSEGSEKFLDELLIWREIAYCFCFHREDHDQPSALPEWALATLEKHRSDPRPALYDWETLARGVTGDELWDAAQRSLLVQGELHNNVRMTWGKALLNWASSPAEALRLLIDLNHRYALDGRDPASYGGLLWCLGQFDRPFEPEQRILGTVRPRPTVEHARRLDPAKYLAKVTAPRFSPVPRVAVIGAGVAGLVTARTLKDYSIPVTIFEKSRGVGGRMATRHTEAFGSFDHGAPCFSACDERFRRYLNAWEAQGLVAPWPTAPQQSVHLAAGQTKPTDNWQDSFVAMPQMNSICKHLSSGLTIQKQVRVQSVKSDGPEFKLADESGNDLGSFDFLICTAPAEQTAELLAAFPEIAKSASETRMKLNWVAMVSLGQSLDVTWQMAELGESWLELAVRNQTKPGRKFAGEQLVLHADSDWTAAHWDSAPEEVGSAMLAEFTKVLGRQLPKADQLIAHRWKYATTIQPSKQRCLSACEDRVLACGDWTGGVGVEGAFLSGASAAGRVLNRLLPAVKSISPVQRALF